MDGCAGAKSGGGGKGKDEPERYRSEEPAKSKNLSGSAISDCAISTVDGLSLTPTVPRNGFEAAPKSGTVVKRDFKPDGRVVSAVEKYNPTGGKSS